MPVIDIVSMAAVVLALVAYPLGRREWITLIERLSTVARGGLATRRLSASRSA